MTSAEFRDAYERHKDPLFRFALRMLGSAEAAEDVVHDCFLLLWRERLGYDGARGPLRNFLMGVTRNLVLKRIGREGITDEWTQETEGVGPVDLVSLEVSEMVSRAVAALPALQREALILAEYEEMPLAEIGVVTGADLAAVKSRLHRARVNLRRVLAPLLPKGAMNGKR